MSDQPPRSGLFEPEERIRFFDGPTLMASAIVFAIGLAGFLTALSMASPSGGANIGAGIAMFVMMAAVLSGGLSVFIAGVSTERARTILLVIAWMILFNAGKWTLFLGWGIFLELSGHE
ncbi:MAG TPA: hypothetical protein VGB52_05440 [Actinomycetota bacterium]